MNNLSVFIITKDEENNLPKCLISLQNFADEVIVVDGYSTDCTKQIAQDFGAEVFERKFESFSTQKQFALDKCTKKWALNLDADEELTPELKEEISKTIKNTDAVMIKIPVQNIFLGRKMKYSGLKGVLKERLVLRGMAHYTSAIVHEKLQADGKIICLQNPFLHTPYRDIEHYFKKFNFYTTLGAKDLYVRGKRFKFYNLLRAPLDFCKIYFLKLAFMDGVQGFLWSLFSSFYPTVKYAKLWQLEKTASNKPVKKEISK